MNVPKVNKDAISYCYFVYNGSVEIEKDKPIRFELQSILLLVIESQRFEFSLDPGRAIYCVYHLPKSVPFAEKGRESLKLVSQKGLRKWNTENFRQPLADSQTYAKVLIPRVLQMTDILFIQSIRKSNHFRFLVLCNLPPLRFTTILGHLIKGVLKPFEMRRQHLQTKQKKL